MAKTKKDKKLYGKMREHGIRKSVAKDLSELPAHVSGGKQAPKPLRDAVERLEGLVQELKGHTDSGDRQTAARKGARTRSKNAASRSASARKAARTRAKAGGSSGPSTRSASATKSRTRASAAKPRSTASRSTASRSTASRSTASKSRAGASAAKPRARRTTAKTGSPAKTGSRS